MQHRSAFPSAPQDDQEGGLLQQADNALKDPDISFETRWRHNPISVQERNKERFDHGRVPNTLDTCGHVDELMQREVRHKAGKLPAYSPVSASG